MIESSVVHDTFAIQRRYLATPSRVFRAFASAEARKVWWCDGGGGRYDLDFRVGGGERFTFASRPCHTEGPTSQDSAHGAPQQDMTYQFCSIYYDIVVDQRIIYSYEMYAGDARVSVSVATIEIAKNGDGTALVWTEQGAYLDGFDGLAAPKLREEGTNALLDQLTSYLDSQASH